VSGLKRIWHGEFAMVSGEMSSNEFTAFLTSVFGQLVQHSDDGSIHQICIDWRHLHEISMRETLSRTQKCLCLEQE
jgi:hypothetical protein